MALVCPVDHPPGVGTSFCRICGRTYVEVAEEQSLLQLALAGAGPVASVETPAPFAPPTAAAG
ncbi:MAG: hypothetical protein M3P04_06555, partial [Actinomycetota bacterium]|nr:hypothetical protein [Actinomycetota bacterium]